ncbi:putative type VI secretion system effector [Rahnella aquatilis]|uniref:putative type VI secretion system effector n=1 Tax=Rahnella aquatilis TaxID=34038 RepID=UPI003647888D
MEKETDEQLYNYTSCLRSEFKDPDRLEGCYASLNIYITSRTESINEYDETYHSSNATESCEERQNREYIDTLRERVIRAKEYLRQVEAEKNSFPPLPELPPTKQLIKISGIVEELSVKKVIGYFDFSEYSTEKARAEEKIKRDNEGASLLLLLQFFAGDAPHARFNDGKRKESKCSYIKGKVNGKIFSGWLRQTNVQVGDYVEMAVMPEGNNYYIYALATPHKGVISTIPNCYAGRRYPNIKQLATMYGKFYTIVFLIMCLFETPTIEQLLYAILVVSSFTATTTYFVYRGMINENRAPGELFEEICNVLNIPNGKKIKSE